jgi:antagonist of KipI
VSRGTPRLRPVGEAAFSIELGEGIDPEVAGRVRALDRALGERAPAWLREAVPTYRSLMVVVDPAAFDEAAARTLELAAGIRARAGDGARHEVPAVYGGVDGPDLEEVARHCGMDAAGYVDRHTREEYTALMLGFLPGFAYLGLLPPDMETARRATPRTRVPAGAVAVARRQTAVYPFRSPGGWNLIGRTSMALFDPRREPPALIQPGDRVRFRRVDALPPAPEAGADAPSPGVAALEVVTPGLLTTVQDGGRRGWRRSGVPWAGAMDTPALARANRAVGNPDGAAGLECTITGPTLRFLRPLRFAVAGADLGAILDRADLGPWPVPRGQPVLARAGNVLRFEGRRQGCRAYLALAGGVAVPLVLGSRATDLTAGFGGWRGRALQAGDVVPAPPATENRGAAAARNGDADPAGELRVVLGPQDEAFDHDARRVFLDARFEVHAESDRVGCRLEGPPVRTAGAGTGEIVSDGMLPGSVQVPPDGQPIVMGADGPTTGGYPKIATVIGADLARLAQLAPGDGVRFREVSAAEARRALEEP